MSALLKISYNDIFATVEVILREHLAYEGHINPKLNLFEMGVDSLDRIELVMLFEDEYGIDISDEAADNIETVNDIVQSIFQRLT